MQVHSPNRQRPVSYPTAYPKLTRKAAHNILGFESPCYARSPTDLF